LQNFSSLVSLHQNLPAIIYNLPFSIPVEEPTNEAARPARHTALCVCSFADFRNQSIGRNSSRTNSCHAYARRAKRHRRNRGQSQHASLWLYFGHFVHRARLGKQTACHSRSQNPARNHAAAQCASASRGLTL